MITKRIASAIAATSILTFGGLGVNPLNTGTQLLPVAQAASIPLSDFNGRLYQSHRGADNQIYTRSSSDGVNWTAWTTAPGGTATYSAPAIAAFNGRLYQAHRGLDNQIYTRSSSDGVSWTAWIAAPAGTITYSAPAMAVFNGRLYQAHRGANNQVYTRSSSDGVSWTAWIEAPAGTITYSAPAIAAFNGRLYQAHRGANNQIYTRSSSDGVNWTGWIAASTETLTYTAPAMAAFNGRLYQAHRGLNNIIFTRSSADGTNWTGWTPALGTIAYSAPAMQAFGGKLYQSHQGMDNRLYTRSTSDGANWTAWTASEGTVTPPEADDLNGTPGPSNLLSRSTDQRRAVLGVNSSSINYSAGGNKFVASNGTGRTYLWCTDYAYGRALEKGLIRNGSGTSYGIGGVIFGNGGFWDDNVRPYYSNSIGSTPRANSFVVWDPGQAGADPQAGHVAFVEAVFSDRSFLISESNASSPMSFNLRHVKPGTSAYTTAKFIYLR